MPGLEYYDAVKGQKNKVSIPAIIQNEAQALARPDDGRKPLRLEFLPELNTALLTIKTFEPDPIKEAGQEYPRFLEAAFQEVKQKNIRNLIIDLRDNDGGEDEYRSLLFSYLTDKEFRYYDRIDTSTNKITFPQYVNADPEVDAEFIYTLKLINGRP